MDYTENAKILFPDLKKLLKFTAIKNLNGISQGEMAVLSHLAFYHNGASAGELSQAFDVGTPRIAAVLNTLERKGYAVRKTDPSDKRKVLVYITDAGRKTACEKQMEAIAYIADLLCRLGENDAKEFIRLIQKTAQFLTESPQSKGCVEHV